MLVNGFCALLLLLLLLPLLLFLDFTMFCNISLYFGSKFSLKTFCCVVVLPLNKTCSPILVLFFTLFLFAI